MEPQQVRNWETDLSSEEDEETRSWAPRGQAFWQGQRDLPRGTILLGPQVRPGRGLG